MPFGGMGSGKRGANVVLCGSILALSATAYLSTALSSGGEPDPVLPRERSSSPDARTRSRLFLSELARGVRAPEPTPLTPEDVARPDELAVESPASASRREIEDLVADLAHDDVCYNAMHAYWRLGRIGKPAEPFLEGALRSPDRQQRQLCAMLLYDLVEEPSARLLSVAVEALEHDRLPHDPGGEDEPSRTTYFNNAHRATRFLVEHPAAARPWLRTKLGSADGQQRFFAACLLGWGKTDEALGLTIDVLVEHLEDNQVSGDAPVAASALASLGEKALPHLRAARAGVDEQARSFLDFLIEYGEASDEGAHDVKTRLRELGVSKYTWDQEFMRAPHLSNLPHFDDRSAGIEPAPVR